jgi:inward rectifier potassium channel
MARYRLLNADGSFNVIRLGLRTRPGRDAYHRLLSMHWRPFFGLVLVAYIAVNLVFGAAYDAFGNIERAAPAGLERFLDCFFFSVQTLNTIGYGRLVPIGLASNILVTFEAMTGLLSLAITTGLVFARFSRPTSRVIFSSRALITPHDGVPSLLFRIVNARANQIVEARIRVGLVINELTLEGEEYRTIHDLPLEREHTAIFAASWTVVHAITRESPLYGQSKESLEKAEAEVLVTLVGTDETFAQTIHSRHSYIPSEIVWNGAFEDMLSRTQGGQLLVDVRRLHLLKGESPAARP